MTQVGSTFTIAGLPRGAAPTVAVDDRLLDNPVVISNRTQGVRYDNLAVLNLDLGSHDEVGNIRGTSAVSNIFGHAGNGQYFVSNVASETLASAHATQFLTGDLDDILGNLNLSAGSGRNKLMISGEGSVNPVVGGVITDHPTSPTALPGSEIELRQRRPGRDRLPGRRPPATSPTASPSGPATGPTS